MWASGGLEACFALEQNLSEFVLGLKSSNGISSATAKGGFNPEALDGLKGEKLIPRIEYEPSMESITIFTRAHTVN